ncbi:protein phosphatase 1 regulatory subunit 14C [Alligator mississippiensis]|uniref:Protein phosphatase 1 regulatory subunit 14C n=1 Tax=Alligator mississippiensis TaxID=8496 RepID=A0A151NLT6_ALLMI|nr:protein phosphatase 1 regulatory subunit 14C [Alligator mississippiensis]
MMVGTEGTERTFSLSNRAVSANSAYPLDLKYHKQIVEEEMPDVEIDIDDLLDEANEEERALKLQETLVDCYKPTEEFIKELLTRIRGMRKLSPPQKKTI